MSSELEQGPGNSLQPPQMPNFLMRTFRIGVAMSLCAPVQKHAKEGIHLCSSQAQTRPKNHAPFSRLAACCCTGGCLLHLSPRLPRLLWASIFSSSFSSSRCVFCLPLRPMKPNTLVTALLVLVKSSCSDKQAGRPAGWQAGVCLAHGHLHEHYMHASKRTHMRTPACCGPWCTG